MCCPYTVSLEEEDEEIELMPASVSHCTCSSFDLLFYTTHNIFRDDGVLDQFESMCFLLAYSNKFNLYLACSYAKLIDRLDMYAHPNGL